MGETARYVERDLRTFIQEVYAHRERVSLTLHPMDRGMAGLELGSVLVCVTFEPSKAASFFVDMAVSKGKAHQISRFVVRAHDLNRRRISQTCFSLAPN